MRFIPARLTITLAALLIQSWPEISRLAGAQAARPEPAQGPLL